MTKKACFQICLLFPQSQLLGNQNGNIAPSSFWTCEIHQTSQGHFWYQYQSIPIGFSSVQGILRRYSFFVHFIHSMNQENILQEAENVRTHATVSYQCKSNSVHGHLQPKNLYQKLSQIFPKSRIHEPTSTRYGSTEIASARVRSRKTM